MSSFGTTMCDIAGCSEPWETMAEMHQVGCVDPLRLKKHRELRLCKNHVQALTAGDLKAMWVDSDS